MKRYPKVSLLLLNYNGLNFTKTCVRQLLRTNYPNFEIIVVDNHSDHDEAGVLRRLFGNKITLIRNTRNLGYSVGMNIAMRKARGEYVAFLNNDMEFPKSWLAPMVQVLNEHPDIAACQPKIRDLKKRSHFEYSLAAGGMIDFLGYPLARGRMFNYVEEDRGQYDQHVFICWGGVLLVRRETLKKTGGFDPIFFHNMEDIDLCFRIWGTGGKIAFVPESVVYHYGGAIIARNVNRKAFFIHRNNLILIIKNWSAPKLATLIIPRILLDGIAIVHYVRAGAVGMAVSVVRAYLSLLSMVPEIFTARHKAQSILDQTLLTMMPEVPRSLIWEFFIRKKRKYSELTLTEPGY